MNAHNHENHKKADAPKADEKVKLFNKGERRITIGKDAEGADVYFDPKKTLLLDAALATKLKRLYPDEVQSAEDALDPFKGKTAAPEVAAEPAKQETKTDDKANETK